MTTPPDHVLVPRIPTEEMLRAGVECPIYRDPEITKLKGFAKQRLKTIQRWRAMIDAAPTTASSGVNERLVETIAEKMRADYVLKYQPNKKSWAEIDDGMKTVWLLHASSAIKALSLADLSQANSAGGDLVLVPRECNFDFGSILDQNMGPDSTWGAIIAAVAQQAEASGLNPDQVSVRLGPAAPPNIDDEVLRGISIDQANALFMKVQYDKCLLSDDVEAEAVVLARLRSYVWEGGKYGIAQVPAGGCDFSGEIRNVIVALSKRALRAEEELARATASHKDVRVTALLREAKEELEISCERRDLMPDRVAELIAKLESALTLEGKV